MILVLSDKICRRCGEPVITYSNEYEVFEGMHWICFHFEFEHDAKEPDMACSDPACPMHKFDIYEQSDKDTFSLSIVSTDKKSIIRMELVETDPRDYGVNIAFRIKRNQSCSYMLYNCIKIIQMFFFLGPCLPERFKYFIECFV